MEWIPLSVQPPKGAAKGARGGGSRRYFAGFTRAAMAGGAAAAEFKVGDTVLLRAERSDLPPYIARLEALYEERAAPAATPRAEARCRWFYRPEDTDFAMKDPREIFFSHVRAVAAPPSPLTESPSLPPPVLSLTFPRSGWSAVATVRKIKQQRKRYGAKGESSRSFGKLAPLREAPCKSRPPTGS
jgi:hypothetical protein